MTCTVQPASPVTLTRTRRKPAAWIEGSITSRDTRREPCLGDEARLGNFACFFHSTSDQTKRARPPADPALDNFFDCTLKSLTPR